MNNAQRLANEINLIVGKPQFTYIKARAVARGDVAVNWPATKALNEDFNPDVDGCESFIMSDGSVCEWQPGQFKYKPR